MGYRVTEPHAVKHPITQDYVVPSPTVEYADDEPLVRAYPWLFTRVEAPTVEAATAVPGEKRDAKLPKA